MIGKRLRKTIEERKNFAITLELSGTPNFGIAPIKHFLESYAGSSKDFIPKGFEFVGYTCTQSPGGAPGIEPATVLSLARSEDLLGDLDFIPHVSCKDQNKDSILASLMGFKFTGVESMLIITGDKPLKSKKVFDVESVGCLDMISDINAQSYMQVKPDQLDTVHQFYPAAAVSPFKYDEPSQMQQYYKMEKKIVCGAEFLITQVGWDWKKSVELMTYLKERGLDIPVMGNVFFLSSTTAAPRLMNTLKLPGCFVSDELLAKVNSETLEDHIERAAQQIAMYKSIGAAGVDIGSVHDLDLFKQIINRAAEIGDDWEQFKDNLCWPDKNPFYLYDDEGARVTLSKPRKKFSQRYFDFMHKAVLDEDYPGFHAFKKTMKCLGAEKGEGFIYKGFNTMEKIAKYILFDCEECGDCFLPEHFGLCTMGGCEKGLANVPCGDSTADGMCGNNLDRVCIGELVYNAAVADSGVDKWLTTICPPRNIKLDKTSSILNYLFGIDHTKKSPLISIGETLDSYSPKTGAIMKMLAGLGEDAYTKHSGPLNYIKALIKSQARENPEYILVNIDAVAKGDDAVEMIKQYAHLVRRNGRGVAIAIDSANKDVLVAGLKEWYTEGTKVKKPLVIGSSIALDEVLSLSKDYDFAVGVVLKAESADQLCEIAISAMAKATGAGLKEDDVFFMFDTAMLAKDIPAQMGQVSSTHKTFEAIKRLKANVATAKGHIALRVTIAAFGMPRRIGVCRAYAAKAMEFGMDAGVVNVAHRYGSVPAAKDLVAQVEVIANVDGTVGAHEKAVQLQTKITKKKK